MDESVDRGRRPTQADIARRVGVSQATVSLVLNGRAVEAGIPLATQRRVAEAIRSLGYVANPVARTLAGGMNRILGVYTFEPAFPLDGDDFYFPFLVGIERAAESLGYDLLMFTSTGAERRMFTDGATRLSLADGALLLGREPDVDDICRLRDGGYRFVYIGRHEVPGISMVTADYAGATRAVTERLAGLGHRRFARWRLRHGSAEAAKDREAGFRQALSEAGMTARQPRTLDSVDEVPALHDALAGSTTTALVVDQQALAEALADHCRAVGSDLLDRLSVAVLGDTIGVRPTAAPRPEWSGFRVPREEMGAAATRALVTRLGSDVDEQVTVPVPCEPVVGATVFPTGGNLFPEGGRNSSEGGR
jgi:DNA-binding LacI/PurR family transcriptional regulator